MRTIIEINDELLREAKGEAANRGVPLRRIVDSALDTNILIQARRRQLGQHAEAVALELLEKRGRQASPAAF